MNAAGTMMSSHYLLWQGRQESGTMLWAYVLLGSCMIFFMIKKALQQVTTLGCNTYLVSESHWTRGSRPQIARILRIKRLIKLTVRAINISCMSPRSLCILPKQAPCVASTTNPERHTCWHHWIARDGPTLSLTNLLNCCCCCRLAAASSQPSISQPIDAVFHAKKILMAQQAVKHVVRCPLSKWHHPYCGKQDLSSR